MYEPSGEESFGKRRRWERTATTFEASPVDNDLTSLLVPTTAFPGKGHEYERTEQGQEDMIGKADSSGCLKRHQNTKAAV